MTRSNDSQKIIVVGIPKTFDDAQLSDLFGEFGAVVEAKVVLDAATSVSRGFGFVTFTAASAMRSAIKGVNRKVVNGRTLNVRQLVPKDEFQSQKKETEDVSQRPCWLLRKGKCTKGANCPFSHDIKDGEYGNCFEFVQTGECKRGDKCKFSHPKREAGDDEEEENVGQKVDKKDNNKPEKRVCYSYQNGRCHRGKKCLFVHEMLAGGAETLGKKAKEEKKPVKEPFEVVNKTDVGKKRRRPDDSETESEKEEEAKSEKTHTLHQKAPAAAGLAAHVNSFMSKTPAQQKQQSGPKKFEWKAKVESSNTMKQAAQHQVNEEPEHVVKQEVRRAVKQESEHVDRGGEAYQRPVKKMKTERIDMGAAFDSDDDSRPRKGKFKRVVDKETMRANREKLKLERRAKRGAKKTALSNLQTKAEVQLGA